MVEMIRSGTTTFNEQYFYPEVTAEVTDQCGLRAAIAIPLINVPTNYAQTPDEAFAKGDGLIEKYKNHPRIQITAAPHASYTVSDETLLKTKKYSDEHDMLVHMHLHEAPHEVAEGVERPLHRLKRLELLNEKLIAVHMVHLSDEEVDWLEEYKINVVSCPESNLKLGNGMCSASKIWRKTNLCLGTDGAASNDDLDMLGELHTAALIDIMQSVTTYGSVDSSIPNTHWLRVASLNGAKALRIDDKVGSISVGKLADFAAVKVVAYPVYDIYNTLALNSTNRVTDVWVGVKPLMRNEVVLVLDEAQVERNSAEWGKKIVECLKK